MVLYRVEVSELFAFFREGAKDSGGKKAGLNQL